MYENARSLHVEEMEKLDPDPDPDQSENLIDFSLAEVLSFHKIWFKSVNNLSRYPGDSQTQHRQPKSIR